MGSTSVVQGAQFLAMLLRDTGMPSPEYAQATPAALAGVVVLVGCDEVDWTKSVTRGRRGNARLLWEHAHKK